MDSSTFTMSRKFLSSGLSSLVKSITSKDFVVKEMRFRGISQGGFDSSKGLGFLVSLLKNKGLWELLSLLPEKFEENLLQAFFEILLEFSRFLISETKKKKELEDSKV